MKLHLPVLLRGALLACLALSSTLDAATYIAEGVDAKDVADSTRFYDGGKGYYWGAFYTEIRNAVADERSYKFLGELYDRVPSAYKGTQTQYIDGAFSNLRDDANTCWAYASDNIIQYWQSYYGVFSSQAEDLPYGLTYSKSYLDDFGGTQSLELNMFVYDNWLNEGGSIAWLLPWYMRGSTTSVTGLMRPEPAAAGFFSKYYTTGDSTYSGMSVDAKTSATSFSQGLAKVLGYTANADGSYTLATKGQIAYIGMYGPEVQGGHAITCYGFDTDADGNISSLRVTNSDDAEYKLFTLYVKRNEAGEYFLYTDAACTKLWKYASSSWYIDEVYGIRTPQVLQDMLDEYSDASKPLYWNGGATSWGGKAGRFTTDELPTSATGWEAVAGTGTDYAGNYASYFDAARPVIFDDRAVGGNSTISVVSNVSTPSMTVSNSKVDYAFDGGTNKYTVTVAGDLAKSGTKSLTFTNTTVQAAKATITGGWMELGSGASIITDTISVTGNSSGLHFSGGSGTLTGALSVDTGAEIEFSSATTLSATSLTCADTSTVSMDLGSANTATPLLSFTGDINLNSALLSLDLGSSTVRATDTYTLAKLSSGTLSLDSLFNFSVSGSGYAASGLTAELHLDAAGQTLSLAFLSAPSYYWEGGTSGNWSAAKWSREDDSSANLKTYEDKSVACLTNGSADIKVDAVASAAILKVVNGTYSLTQASKLTVQERMDLDQGAKLTVDVAPTLSSGAALHIIDAASSLTVTSGDLALRTLDSEGRLTLEGGSLRLTGAVAKGGTVDVSGSVVLAANSANTFTAVKAGSLSLDDNSTLTVSGELETGKITLATVGGESLISVGSLANSVTALDFTLAASAQQDLKDLGLISGELVDIFSSKAALASSVGLTVGSDARITLGDYDYVIGRQGGTVQLTAVLHGVTEWTSSDAVWSDKADWNNADVEVTTKVGFLGKGTEEVAVNADRTVGGIIVESVSKKYATSGTGTLCSGSLNVSAGSLELGNSLTDVSGEVSVRTRGELAVAEGKKLKAGSLSVNGSFSNKGTTEVTGALEAPGRTVVSSGTLIVGNGTNIGTLKGGGSLQTNGAVAVARADSLGNLTVNTGSALTLMGSEETTVSGSFVNKGSLEAARIAFTQVVAQGGNVSAARLALAGSGNTFTALSGSYLDLSGTLSTTDALVKATSFTLNGNGVTVNLADREAALGRYLIMSTDGGITVSTLKPVSLDYGEAGGQSPAFELSAETQLAYKKRHLIGAMSVEGDDLYCTFTTYAASVYEDAATSENGRAAGRLVGKLSDELVPQQNRGRYADIAELLDALDASITADDNAEADRLAASAAGASIPALGLALAGDVDRQLRAIRNRMPSMGIDPRFEHPDLPYVNGWINAEGDYRKLDGDGTASGYTLSSWGGTVGFDVDANEQLSFGLACSALYGDFRASGVDVAKGDMDTYYATAFARWSSGAWVHSFVFTAGWADISLERTVTHSQGGYRTCGEADGSSWGALYELAYTISASEDNSVCWQPVANISYVHAGVDGYSEEGSDAAIEADAQSIDRLGIGLGARMQAIVGENIYNRSSVLELRALLKADVGDREGESDVAFSALPGHTATMSSNDYGAVGFEVGAGLAVPVSANSGELFFDVSAEFRSGYSNVNGVVGWRFHF